MSAVPAAGVEWVSFYACVGDVVWAYECGVVVLAVGALGLGDGCVDPVGWFGWGPLVRCGHWPKPCIARRRGFGPGLLLAVWGRGVLLFGVVLVGCLASARFCVVLGLCSGGWSYRHRFWPLFDIARATGLVVRRVILWSTSETHRDGFGEACDYRLICQCWVVPSVLGVPACGDAPGFPWLGVVYELGIGGHRVGHPSGCLSDEKLLRTIPVGPASAVVSGVGWCVASSLTVVRPNSPEMVSMTSDLVTFPSSRTSSRCVVSS